MNTAASVSIVWFPLPERSGGRARPRRLSGGAGSPRSKRQRSSSARSAGSTLATGYRCSSADAWWTGSRPREPRRI